MNRIAAVALLLVRLARDLLVSAWRTARAVLSPVPPAGGFIRMRYPPMSDGGVVVYASIVALSPGSTFVAIDVERREIAVHILDMAMASAIVEGIRRDYEGPLVTLFGSGQA